MAAANSANCRCDGDGDDETPSRAPPSPAVNNAGATSTSASSITNAASIAGVIVVAVCGLPGAGKSRLCRQLLRQGFREAGVVDSRRHLIEYDAVQDRHVAEASTGGAAFATSKEGRVPAENSLDDDDDAASASATDNNERTVVASNDLTLEAWRRTRVTAVQRLRSLIRRTAEEASAADASAAGRPALIVMDDNFHLRSMRKRIYQACQEEQQYQQQQQQQPSQAKSKTRAAGIYFVVLWVDTPLEICLERNRRRGLPRESSDDDDDRSRPVPEDVITKMSESAQLPDPSYYWERINFRVDGSGPVTDNGNENDGSDNRVQLVFDFLSMVPSRYEQVRATSKTPEEEEEERRRLEAERRKTLQSERHRLDHMLRGYVRIVAQFKPQCAQLANKVRQAIMKNESDQVIRLNNLMQVFLDKLFDDDGNNNATGGSSPATWTFAERERLMQRLLNEEK